MSVVLLVPSTREAASTRFVSRLMFVRLVVVWVTKPMIHRHELARYTCGALSHQHPPPPHAAFVSSQSEHAFADKTRH